MKNQIVSALSVLVVLFVLLAYIDSIAHEEITSAVKMVITFLSFLVVLAGGGLLVIIFLVGYERFMRERANRRAAQREADVMVVVADQYQQVYIREQNQHATWRNAHLDSRTYANGKPSQATPTEQNNWRVWALSNQPVNVLKQSEQLLLQPPQVNLLAELDIVQRCLIVGASNSGKTTLLQHLINRRQANSKVVVIDPHAWPDKWPGCTVLGRGRNYPEIDRALSALVQLMTKRYDEIGRGDVAEGNHAKLTIIIDEWRAIVANVKSAGDAIKALLTESRKAAFSVFVGTHSDRAKPLGLEGEYDLKDGFAIIRLSIVNGQRQATLDTGNGEQPAALPGPFNPHRPTIEADYLNLDIQPTPTEAAVLDLHKQGKIHKEICENMNWTAGGNQYERIDSILAKFS